LDGQRVWLNQIFFIDTVIIDSVAVCPNILVVQINAFYISWDCIRVCAYGNTIIRDIVIICADSNWVVIYGIHVGVYLDTVCSNCVSVLIDVIRVTADWLNVQIDRVWVVANACQVRLD